MKKQLFIYHGNCFDGFTAAWVFDRFRKQLRDPIMDGEVEYFPAMYGKEPPDCKGKEVWVVDFSYDRQTMIEKVIKPSTRTFIFDHHQTAQAALDGILDEVRTQHRLQRDKDLVVFDMNRCGSAILYDYLEDIADKKAGFRKPRYNGLRDLWLIDYIDDRDRWVWKQPDSKEVSAYISATPMTFENWESIAAIGRRDVAEGGRAILKYIDLFGVKVREQAVFHDLAGYNVPTINTPYMNCSDHVGGLCEQYPDAKFAVGYFARSDGQWQFSLRSRGEFDVSEIAKQFGGGGHKNASGFNVGQLPWDGPRADQSIVPVAAEPDVYRPLTVGPSV
jgi:oligoribonuclease NrnB/cAMP/cGMP phosphodiesterase (DHH superfamily)